MSVLLQVLLPLKGNEVKRETGDQTHYLYPSDMPVLPPQR